MKLIIPLILASGSPRRKRLLEQLGLAFTVHPSGVDEDVTMASASATVRTLAKYKAATVAEKYPDALVLGADTCVVLDDAILGKPRTTLEATRMLGQLQDRTHRVLTGIALVHRASARESTHVEMTEVDFGPLSGAEIEEYVRSGSPMDKAGAYGIQDEFGAVFVRQIRGDYFNVVGLPLHTFYQILKFDFSDLLTK